MIKLLKTKDKEKILKAVRENDIIQIKCVVEAVDVDETARGVRV